MRDVVTSQMMLKMGTNEKHCNSSDDVTDGNQ